MGTHLEEFVFKPGEALGIKASKSFGFRDSHIVYIMSLLSFTRERTFTYLSSHNLKPIEILHVLYSTSYKAP